jgi:hypothetical protein
MYYPFKEISKDIIDLFLAVFQKTEIKAEIAKQVRTEIDTYRTKSGKYDYASVDALTSGSVSMQQKMAASGYDVYGRTIMSSNKNVGSTANVYQRQRNKIHYGRRPEIGYENQGNYTIG